MFSILLFFVGVNENGPGQGISGELPAAHWPAPFGAGFAVPMPVYLFSYLDCFLPSHSDTTGASDKGVSEIFNSFDFFRL